MSPFTIGLLVGLFTGFLFGFAAAAIMAMQRSEPEELDNFNPEFERSREHR